MTKYDCAHCLSKDTHEREFDATIERSGHRVRVHGLKEIFCRTCGQTSIHEDQIRLNDKLIDQTFAGTRV